MRMPYLINTVRIPEAASVAPRKVVKQPEVRKKRRSFGSKPKGRRNSFDSLITKRVSLTPVVRRPPPPEETKVDSESDTDDVPTPRCVTPRAPEDVTPEDLIHALDAVFPKRKTLDTSGFCYGTGALCYDPAPCRALLAQLDNPT